jgi:glycosyltransferase involved in cell wall biosynthesis
MSRRRITFVVHDLAANPIVRAAALARAIERDCDVEMIGFLHSGTDVYEPYRHLFDYRAMFVPRDTATVLRAIPSLASRATGDIVYACKPLVTSFGAALYAARFAAHRPLLLDVEDDEWATGRTGWSSFLWRDVTKGWRHATAWKYTRALHAAVRCADAITVSTRTLQRRYGGTVVRHGPAADGYDPERISPTERVARRRAWNVTDSTPVALFAGVPQPHKGWPTLMNALQHPRAADWHLVLAGPADHPDFAAAARILGSRCHVIGPQAHTSMPALLSAVDAVPVPQLDVAFARSQLPAKLLEAMASMRAVVATTVGDLPELLGHGSRGWLVPPGDSGALAAALHAIAASPDEAALRGRAARDWYLAEASQAAMRDRLLAIIDALEPVAALAHG